MSKAPDIRFAGFNNDWEQRKLGDFCDMFNGDRGVNYPKDADMVTDGIPFVNAGDLQEGKVNLTTANKITREKFEQLGGAKIKRGDILYCLRGTLGKNAFFDNFDEGTVASSLVDIRAKNIYPQYLFTVLNSDIEYRQRILCNEGAAQPNLSATNLANFDIPVPQIEEQRKIGAFFKSLDHLITLHQRKLQTLINFKASMLDKMFPKEGKTVPEIRFAGFNDDWEQRKLKSIVVGHNAGVYINKNDYGNGINIVGVGNIYDSDAVDGQIYRLAPVKDKQYILDEGDIIYGESSLVPEGIARTMYVTKKGAGTAFAWHTRRVKLNRDICDSHFATLELNYNQQVRKYLMNVSTQTALTGMTTEGYFGATLYLPSLTEQQQIGAFFTKLDNLITLHQRKLEKLQNFKVAMLDKMFPKEAD